MNRSKRFAIGTWRFSISADARSHPPMSPSNLKILAYLTTPLGELCLRRRALLADPDTVITEIHLMNSARRAALF